MTGPCFVDADVFVYARDPRDAAKQARALQWIAHLWQERLGRTSVHVLSEYYVFATRTLKPNVAPGARPAKDVRATRGRLRASVV